MKILTRSSRIRRALRQVQKRIPGGEWRSIDSFLTWVRSESQWQVLGLGGDLNPCSAALLPLYDVEDLSVRGAQIILTLPPCRLYSNKAIIGLVAHELAHALRAVYIGKEWLEKMGGADWDAPGADRRYKSEERRADAIASAWGFRAQILAMRDERAKVLNPYIHAHEAQILRRMARSEATKNEEAGKRIARLTS
jgi:hypothetical protein